MLNRLKNFKNKIYSCNQKFNRNPLIIQRRKNDKMNKLRISKFKIQKIENRLIKSVKNQVNLNQHTNKINKL